MGTKSITDAVVKTMRRERVHELNNQPKITRESLEAKYGQVGDMEQMASDFNVTG